MKYLLISSILTFSFSILVSQVWVCGVPVGDEYAGDTILPTQLGGLNGVIQIKQHLLDNRVVSVTFRPTKYGFMASPVSSATFNKFIKKLKKQYKTVFIEHYEYQNKKDFPYDHLFYAIKYEYFILSYAVKYLNNDKNRIVFAFQVADTRLMPGDNFKKLWDKNE